jgi:hypothetical protein
MFSQATLQKYYSTYGAVVYSSQWVRAIVTLMSNLRLYPSLTCGLGGYETCFTFMHYVCLFLVFIIPRTVAMISLRFCTLRLFVLCFILKIGSSGLSCEVALVVLLHLALSALTRYEYNILYMSRLDFHTILLIDGVGARVGLRHLW